MTVDGRGRFDERGDEAHRGAEKAGERGEELAGRRAELKEQIRRGEGSDREQAEMAADRLERAQRAAALAAELTATAKDSSARAHDEAASLHGRLADAGSGDVAVHRVRAQEHHQAADADRVVAQEDRRRADGR
ncbi:hypothetical protein [Actinoplanes sichuanensis]|uniref:Uncharacterized protein n=1 Tax=Actinoplanes sichuanensis TaxID=512349 RepID=A0ABW4A2T5_9ACTN